MNTDKRGTLIENKKDLPILYQKRENCCGCTACYAICPVQAIKMLPDEEGFLYPVVNAEVCIRCYRCLSVCTFKGQSSYIKPFVDEIHQQIMFAEKSWGSFRVLDVEDESMTIRVKLNPGHRMNYHSHDRRDEIWNIVSGTGRTIVDGMEQPVGPGDVVTMQAGCKHTIIADTALEVIEVQLGREISVNDKHKYELEF